MNEKLLANITQKLSSMSLKIKSFEFEVQEGNKAKIYFTVKLKNTDDYKFIINGLENMEFVESVKKVTKVA